MRIIIKSGGVVIDDEMRILEEYKNNLSMSGQPGPGDAFMKWVWDNQANPRRCEQVRITEDAAKGFAEFPDDQRLADFDRSDRKFVAVALASRNRPEILNAVDSDWWNCRVALEECGVIIRFLCPNQFGDRAERQDNRTRQDLPAR
ncbi:MAG TPA: hypothetical protein PL033_18475 [Candidatus Brocadiia bacterium]|nr:hypothetical protein [Candidatus Brocadiia bacterium]